MPSGIQEAFKSPFHRSNPSSQFYDMNSFTKSSHSDSIRNEYFQGQIGSNPSNQIGTTRLPNYSPQVGDNLYPTLHPTSFDGQSSDTNSLRQDSNQPSYLNPFPTNLPDINNQNGPSKFGLPPLCQGTQITSSNPVSTNPVSTPNLVPPPDLSRPRIQDSCDNLLDDDLIHRVLANQRCREMLKKLLLENQEEPSIGSKIPLPPYKHNPKIEGFTDGSNYNYQNPNSETIKTVLIYSLGGLLILCLLDVFVKLGQIINRGQV